MLTVPILAVSAYYSEVILWDDGGAQVIWHISITEYMVYGLLSFLAAARERSACVVCVDYRMGGNVRGVSVPLLPGIGREVDDIGLLDFIHGNGLMILIRPSS